MPSKAQPDENLLFLYRCIQNHDGKVVRLPFLNFVYSGTNSTFRSTSMLLGLPLIPSHRQLGCATLVSNRKSRLGLSIEMSLPPYSKRPKLLWPRTPRSGRLLRRMRIVLKTTRTISHLWWKNMRLLSHQQSVILVARGSSSMLRSKATLPRRLATVTVLVTNTRNLKTQAMTRDFRRTMTTKCPTVTRAKAGYSPHIPKSFLSSQLSSQLSRPLLRLNPSHLRRSKRPYRMSQTLRAVSGKHSRPL